MFDFTEVEKHDTTLSEFLWNNGFRDLSDKLDDIEDCCNDCRCDLLDAFEEALSNICDFDLDGYEEIDSDDMYDFVYSDEFKDLVNKTHEVAMKLDDVDVMDAEHEELCVEAIEFFATFDPYNDAGINYGEGKIDFYIETVDQSLDDPNELIEQLKAMREDVNGETEDAKAIDDLIERLTELNKEEE